MNVIIAPNLNKTSERINPSGDIIDPKTGGILRKNESGYIPTQNDIAKMDERIEQPSQNSSPIEKKIEDIRVKQEIALTHKLNQAFTKGLNKDSDPSKRSLLEMPIESLIKILPLITDKNIVSKMFISLQRPEISILPPFVTRTISTI